MKLRPSCLLKINCKKQVWLFFLFPCFVFSLSQDENLLSQGLDFPLMSSFGGAGIAGRGSAEYHVLNPSALIQSSAQAVGFYFFNQGESQYGGSAAVQEGLPLAVTWARKGSEHHRVFSLAGRLHKYWAIGGGVHYFTEKPIIPHIGLIYTPTKNLRLGFTGSRVDKEFIYGVGFFYDWDKKIRILSDVVHQRGQTTVHGGVELFMQDVFSLRGGLVWPYLSYRAGISFISFPIKVDYTWIQNEGHSVGLRIQSPRY